MERWLKDNGFKEVIGVWYRFMTLTTLAIYIGEHGDWSACYGKGYQFSLNNDNLLFSDLPEDQAKESVAMLVSL